MKILNKHSALIIMVQDFHNWFIVLFLLYFLFLSLLQDFFTNYFLEGSPIGCLCSSNWRQIWPEHMAPRLRLPSLQLRAFRAWRAGTSGQECFLLGYNCVYWARRQATHVAMCGLMLATGQTIKGVILLCGAIDSDHHGDLPGTTHWKQG